MTITLTPEIETAIAEQAHQKGIQPEQLALDGLQNLFVPAKLTPDEILGLAAQVHAGLSQQLDGRELIPLRYGAYQAARLDRAKGQADLILREGMF
jgi:hypothetical protein